MLLLQFIPWAGSVAVVLMVPASYRIHAAGHLIQLLIIKNHTCFLYGLLRFFFTFSLLDLFLQFTGQFHGKLLSDRKHRSICILYSIIRT